MFLGFVELESTMVRHIQAKNSSGRRPRRTPHRLIEFMVIAVRLSQLVH